MDGQARRRARGNSLQRKLRRGMTDAERRLWGALRLQQVGGHKFRRQHPFGDYILDFVCLERRLVIEVDGGQHQEMQEEDQARTEVLEKAGFRVLRFWNNEVLEQLDSVMERIWIELHGK